MMTTFCAYYTGYIQ